MSTVSATSTWGNYIREDTPATNYNANAFIEVGHALIANTERVGFLAFDISDMNTESLVQAVELLVRTAVQFGGTITVQRVLRADIVPAEMNWTEAATGVSWGSDGAKTAEVDYTTTNQTTFNPTTNGAIESISAVKALVQDAHDAGQSTLILRFADMVPFAGRTLCTINDQGSSTPSYRPELTRTWSIESFMGGGLESNKTYMGGGMM